MADWKDILSDNEEQLSDEELLKYLDDNIREEDKYFIEKKINNSAFESDALQGLSQVQNKENLKKQVSQLNQKLYQLTSKKTRKEKRKINIYQWIILTILILLFVCIIGYVIISLQNKGSIHTHLHFKSRAVFLLV